ncbi:hypothetical protein [Sphingobacterium psychroaquaticum]
MCLIFLRLFWNVKMDGKGREKKWVSDSYRTAQPNTLALFPTWGSQWELVVGDLPATKVGKN